jgi:hypothetical protein
MRQPWALKVRRMIELDDSLKMEKISKEREGAWDLVLTTLFTRDCVVHTNRLWLNVEVMISDLNQSYRAIKSIFSSSRSRYCVWVLSPMQH